MQSRRTLACYSSVGLPLAAMALPIAVYLPPFYGEELGMSLATVGLMFTLARFWDVITDPLMGMMIDRFETRWGRRKHWIAVAIPILLLSVWMLFLPDPERVSAAWLGFWLFALYIGYTLLTVAHLAWGADLAAGYDDRSRLFTWREAFIIAGMIGVLATPAVSGLLGYDALGIKVASMGWFCLILFPVTALFTLAGAPDRRGAASVGVSWREAARLMAGNRTLWRLLCADLASGFGSTASGSLYILFATHIFQLPSHASLVLLLYFVAGLLAMPLWLKAAYRLGKARTAQIALIYGVIVKIALFLVVEPGNVALFWAYSLCYGVAFGAAPFLLRSMMADLADADELETGRPRPALFYAMLNATNKLGAALAVGTVLTLVEVGFGFSAQGNNAPAALDGFLLVYCAAPVVMAVLAFAPLLGYPLGRAEHEAIRAQLAARRA